MVWSYGSFRCFDRTAVVVVWKQIENMVVPAVVVLLMELVAAASYAVDKDDTAARTVTTTDYDSESPG